MKHELGACEEEGAGRALLAEERELGTSRNFRGSITEYMTFPQTLPEFMGTVRVPD